MKEEKRKDRSFRLVSKSFSVDELYDCFYDELVLWVDTILNDMEGGGRLRAGFFRAVVGEKTTREFGGGTGTVVLVCSRTEYGYSKGEGSEPDAADSGYIGCGKSVGG